MAEIYLKTAIFYLARIRVRNYALETWQLPIIHIM